jgi:hypothetical protein
MSIALQLIVERKQFKWRRDVSFARCAALHPCRAMRTFPRYCLQCYSYDVFGVMTPGDDSVTPPYTAALGFITSPLVRRIGFARSTTTIMEKLGEQPITFIHQIPFSIAPHVYSRSYILHMTLSPETAHGAYCTL